MYTLLGIFVFVLISWYISNKKIEEKLANFEEIFKLGYKFSLFRMFLIGILIINVFLAFIGNTVFWYRITFVILLFFCVKLLNIVNDIGYQFVNTTIKYDKGTSRIDYITKVIEYQRMMYTTIQIILVIVLLSFFISYFWKGKKYNLLLSSNILSVGSLVSAIVYLVKMDGKFNEILWIYFKDNFKEYNNLMHEESPFEKIKKFLIF